MQHLGHVGSQALAIHKGARAGAQVHQGVAAVGLPLNDGVTAADRLGLFVKFKITLTVSHRDIEPADGKNLARLNVHRNLPGQGGIAHQAQAGTGARLIIQQLGNAALFRGRDPYRRGLHGPDRRRRRRLLEVLGGRAQKDLTGRLLLAEQAAFLLRFFLLLRLFLLAAEEGFFLLLGLFLLGSTIAVQVDDNIIQPSGATGFGQEFSARHVNAWGERTGDEIIEGSKKFCAEHNFVDSKKIGCIGASYGGFMSQYLQTKTDIFAAAISHAGISDITSYWGEGYWGYSYSALASANSYPWNARDMYTLQSPLFNADKINTPILFLHGTVDTNVPIGESIQMFTALKLLGKPTAFVQVVGQNHQIFDYKKRAEWNKTIYAWFAKWLKDQPEWWNAMYPEKSL